MTTATAKQILVDIATMMSAAIPARVLAASSLLALGLVGSGCAPEVGSPEWCERMDDTPKGDWTANQAADYARHCLFE